MSSSVIRCPSSVNILPHLSRIKFILSKIESIYQSETVCRFLITVVKEDKDGNVVDSITSVGEATHPKDCKITYVASMAEKRGYDRGVLKLIKAYEWGIYSEVEAEDFKKENSK